jgi:uncharacterized Fe-S cluster-containing radical SAM superfamily protein
MKTIDTEGLSKKYREAALNLTDKTILITNYTGSQQEKDLSEPANCKGFGRVRHFKLQRGGEWPLNPLPILPAVKSLGLEHTNEIRAQVFQNAVCNWRCWYCFVDFKLLNGDKRYSDYLTCDQLLDMYLSEEDAPKVIDLSGGQPDLTPEWVPWMMEAINKKGLNNEIFLWSDDNLSNDYFWRHLNSRHLDVIRTYKNYSRVCCFKGIDETSFHINTKADPNLFYNQVQLFERLFSLGIDLYGYITLNAPTNTDFKKSISKLMDKLQSIHEYLPLRIVPLQIFEFLPMTSRMGEIEKDALRGQYQAIEVWEKELDNRFSSNVRKIPITEVYVK